MTVAGMLLNAGAQSTSFAQMENYSVQAKRASYAPEFIETGLSYATVAQAEDIVDQLKNLGFMVVNEHANVPSVHSWPDFVSAMEEAKYSKISE